MSSLDTTVLLGIVVLVTLLSGLWIFAALIAASALTLMFALDMSAVQVGALLRAAMWRSLTAWEMTAVPVFIFMGELYFAGRLSEELFHALRRKVRRLPGGVLHVNVWGSSLFAAISGSSTATMMTIGRVTVPELRRLGFGAPIAFGSLAGAGTLGILLPPSIPLIVYGILAEQSITKMFMAGVVPGLLVALLYTAYIVAAALWFKAGATPDESVVEAEESGSKGSVLPTLVVIAIVFGGIYSGVVTATEAGVLGCTATIIMCALKRTLSFAVLRQVMNATIGTSANVLIIVASAACLSAAVSNLGVPQYLVGAITEMNLSYAGLILALAVFFLFLGMFIEGLSIMIITIPIVLPVVVAAGGDPVWFGIFLVLLIEIGLLTPPVGVHLFVLQSMSGRSLAWAARASLPFMLLLVLAAFIIALFPQLSLTLPNSL
ncbi:TRAP transporter large permease [Acuticoccus kandeliae]|uniref:TRAP transporter large permease n=1 Tax=Acuticoccus kandeliae TaxID=2073160 RepID=UPI000D3E39D7|nr:TRAP transporter large permease [Acuticoccus kandeliae]